MRFFHVVTSPIKKIYRILLPSKVRQLLGEATYELYHFVKKEQVYKIRVLDYDRLWGKIRYAQPSRERIACYGAASDLINAPSRVLDVGCGKGDFLRFLKNIKEIEGLGIDFSDNAVKTAREAGVNAIKIDATTYNLKQLGSWDYVVLLDFLEHIPNSEEILLRIKEASPGATIIVSIPNAGHYFCRFRLFFGGRFLLQPNHPAWHLRFWTIKDFINMAGNLGLKIDRIVPYFGSSVNFLKNKFPNVFAEYVLFKMHF
jgi:methionine biosynthesis protein MetW